MELLSENNILETFSVHFLSSTSTSYFKTLNKALPKTSPQNALQKKDFIIGEHLNKHHTDKAYISYKTSPVSGVILWQTSN